MFGVRVEAFVRDVAAGVCSAVTPRVVVSASRRDGREDGYRREIRTRSQQSADRHRCVLGVYSSGGARAGAECPRAICGAGSCL
ncbi:hypothetical protein EVAR_83722_1 [Eumeta japonica]|uniref:Uncharacterized protein n=1 Tax=Eumeta variegata TaxID=151549 RepID=A0A4C1WAV9_EUMVA|nr:hypothetical protein EVAR_83722_1 [Eumeta japonica]